MTNRLKLLVALLVVTYQIFLALPASIWTQNQFNFSSPLMDSLGIVGLILGVLAGFSGIFVLITRKAIVEYALPFFAILSVCIFLQQNVLVWNYGILDGSKIDFSNNSFLGVIDAILWLTGIILFIKFRKKVIDKSIIALVFSGVATTLSLASTLFFTESNPGNHAYSLTEEDKFSYSSRKNVYLFVLDGFQSDLFWEIYDRDSDSVSEFTGFTYYPNTTSVFAKTYPTIPLLLTGRTYKKEEPIIDYINSAYKNSLLSELINENWDVRLFPYVQATIALDDEIMSNSVGHNTAQKKLDNYLHSVDLSFFRTTPHFLKPAIYNDGDFLLQNYARRHYLSFDSMNNNDGIVNLPRKNIHQGINFLENLKELGNTDLNKKVFRFYHLYMPHAPFLLDKDLNYRTDASGFGAYREYAYASLKLVAEYLRELKRIGAYDNAAIIITADHGGGEYTNKLYDTQTKDYKTISSYGKQIASGKPLLLVKDFARNEALRVSNKPTSLLDIAPTIAGFADISIKAEGLFVNDIPEDYERERVYYHYSFTSWRSKFLDDFEVFKIKGHAFNEDSWHSAGKLTQKITTDSNPNNYLLGALIRYGEDLQAEAEYLNTFLEGEDHSYTSSQAISESDSLSVSLQLESEINPSALLALDIDFGETQPSISKAQISFSNGKIFSVKIQSPGKFSRILFTPKDIGLRGKQLDFKIMLTGSNDLSNPRASLSALKLSDVNLPRIEMFSNIRFSDDIESFLPEGFSLGEPTGRWTTEKNVAVYFRSTEKLFREATMMLDIERFYNDVTPESLTVTLNGIELNRLKPIRMTQNPTSKIEYELSEKDFGTVGYYKLELKVDNVVSPVSLGRGTDHRTLGLYLRSISFEPKSE